MRKRLMLRLICRGKRIAVVSMRQGSCSGAMLMVGSEAQRRNMSDDNFILLVPMKLLDDYQNQEKLYFPYLYNLNANCHQQVHVIGPQWVVLL